MPINSCHAYQNFMFSISKKVKKMLNVMYKLFNINLIKSYDKKLIVN